MQLSITTDFVKSNRIEDEEVFLKQAFEAGTRLSRMISEIKA